MVEKKARTGNPNEADRQPDSSYKVVQVFAHDAPGLLRENGRVFARIQLTPEEEEALNVPLHERNRLAGLELAEYPSTHPKFAGGMWIGFFNTASTARYWPMYSRGTTALFEDGQIKSDSPAGSLLDQKAQAMGRATLEIVARAISEGRIQPLSPTQQRAALT